MSGQNEPVRRVSRAVSRIIGRTPAPGSSDGETLETRRSGWSLPGLAADTVIETSFGGVPAHLIRKGDPVRLHGPKFQRVLDIRKYHFDPDFLARRPDAVPVRLPRLSSWAGCDTKDIWVSRAQKVLNQGGPTGGTGALVQASVLAVSANARIRHSGSVCYVQLIFRDPVLIGAGGYWFESVPPEE